MRPPTGASGPPVPIQEAVGEFVAMLVDRGAAATKVAPTRLVPPHQLGEDDEQAQQVIAAYRDQHGSIAALSLADLHFAASTGAALGMVPASAVQEAVKAGSLPETLFENYREVANIMTSLLNSPSSPHLKAAEAWLSDDDDVPAEVWDVIAAPSKRREFAVRIEGYGDGRIGIVIR